MQKLDKKGQVSNTILGVFTTVGAIAVILVVITMVMAYGADITEDVRDDQTTNGSAYNISDSGLSNITTLSNKNATFVKVGAAALVLLMIVAAFGGLTLARRR